MRGQSGQPFLAWMAFHANPQAAFEAQRKIAQHMLGMLNLREHALGHREQIVSRLGTSQSAADLRPDFRSEEHTSELQSLMRISYAVFCLNKYKHNHIKKNITHSKKNK